MHLRLVVCLLCFLSLNAKRSHAADAPRPDAPGPVAVHIDVSKRRDPINPHIYGQFIEHLGRCIYGGIWAEMLEDRKFYFPITDKYDPYKSLTDTPFPVVGASPWEIVGRPDGVQMIEKDPFVGEHSPQIAPGTSIRQNDLGMVKGKQYVGYLWMKSADRDKPGAIRITSGAEHDSPFMEYDCSAEFKRYVFSFTGVETTDKAWLKIESRGQGPVVVGTVSVMPADNVRGMRADTLAALKKLNATIYRWPGGNFVSGYNWRDGIGDRDRRPPRKNPAWTGVEHNDVGLDEFLDFCHEVGAEAQVAVNTGFGDAYSAAQEVEYCNGDGDTVGGGWRVKNGHAKPYGVKLWCVGNEMFGVWQLGYMKLDQYVLKHNQFADAMHKADPSIKLIGVGDLTGLDPAGDATRKYPWSEGMLKSCAEHMDLLSEHFYSGLLPWETRQEIPLLEHVGQLREQIRKKADGHRELQKKLGLWPDRKVPVAMDEWNFWHRKYYYGELGCKYDLTDALGVAAGLHEYYRSTDVIHAASYAQTVNVIGCVKTTKTGAFLDTTALPLMIYREHFATVPVEATGDFEEHNLDVVAAVDEAGRVLTVGVVNANAEPVDVPLSVEGASLAKSGQQWVVGGDDPKATNDADHMRVDVKESAVDVGAAWSVPGYSFAVLRVELSK